MSKEIEDLKKQIMWLQNQNASLFNKQEALRDHFAGLAMQGLLISMKFKSGDLCSTAYAFADVMMAEREKGNDH